MTEQPTAVQLAIFNARMESVTRRMANTLLRTGRSGVINTARDFSCSLVTARGELLSVSEGFPIHMLRGADLMAQCMASFHPNLKRGVRADRLRRRGRLRMRRRGQSGARRSRRRSRRAGRGLSSPLLGRARVPAGVVAPDGRKGRIARVADRRRRRLWLAAGACARARRARHRRGLDQPRAGSRRLRRGGHFRRRGRPRRHFPSAGIANGRLILSDTPALARRARFRPGIFTFTISYFWLLILVRSIPWVFLAGRRFAAKRSFIGVGLSWISLDSLVRIETYQWVMRHKARKLFSRRFVWGSKLWHGRRRSWPCGRTG
jgi:hypothetical protein